MIEREGGNLIREIRSIQRELEELKTAQRVGNSQIKVNYFNTGSTMLSFQTVPNAGNQYMSAMGKAKVKFVCDDIHTPNALIAYCLPEIHLGSPTGTLITTESSYSQPVSGIIFNAKSTADNEARFNIQVFDMSMTGSRLYAKTLYVKFHVWMAAKELSSFEWGSGNYE